MFCHVLHHGGFLCYLQFDKRSQVDFSVHAIMGRSCLHQTLSVTPMGDDLLMLPQRGIDILRKIRHKRSQVDFSVHAIMGRSCLHQTLSVTPMGDDLLMLPQRGIDILRKIRHLGFTP
jgi:6-phosphofructokinase